MYVGDQEAGEVMLWCGLKSQVFSWLIHRLMSPPTRFQVPHGTQRAEGPAEKQLWILRVFGGHGGYWDGKLVKSRSEMDPRCKECPLLKKGKHGGFRLKSKEVSFHVLNRNKFLCRHWETIQLCFEYKRFQLAFKSWNWFDFLKLDKSWKMD